MAVLGILLFCLQAVFLNVAFGQCLPGVHNTGASLLGNIEAPMAITSATFTPVNNALASQAGLPTATVTEVFPNLQYGDITLAGDLPIGGTIKVSGCFPVYGMVGVDGILPSFGTAVTSTNQQLPQNANSCAS